jgi:hypothetical protein
MNSSMFKETIHNVVTTFYKLTSRWNRIIPVNAGEFFWVTLQGVSQKSWNIYIYILIYWWCLYKVLIFFKALSMSSYTFFPPTLPSPVRPLKGLDSDVSWLTVLSRSKVIMAASATLCCHLLAHYRANPETFWCTLLYAFMKYSKYK